LVLLVGFDSHSRKQLAVYDESTERLQALNQLTYHRGPTLSVCAFDAEQQRFVITAATDGQIAVWDLSAVCQHVFHQPSIDDAAPFEYISHLQPLMTQVVHQSGVNSLACQVLRRSCDGSTRLLVATGGDDESIHTSVLRQSPNRSWQIESTCRISQAHSSCVTGMTQQL
jgi:WD40 repeat protein